MQSIKNTIPKIEFILDRGFFPHENLDLLKDDSHIIAASLVSNAVKSIFAMASRTVDHADNVFIYNNDPVFCKPVEFTMYDLDLRGYFYHDPMRESDERSDFHRRLAEKRSAVEKLQPRSGVVETIQTVASSYLRYFTWRIDNDRITARARNNAISSAENRMGKFLLVYRGRSHSTGMPLNIPQ